MNPQSKLLARVVQERFARAGRARVPEPMAMDGADAVTAFDRVHPILQAPIYRVNALALSRLLPQNGNLLDLGSGSGRLLIELALARPDVHIAGRDLAPNMVAAAAAAIADAGVGDRVSVAQGDMTSVTDVPERVDVVSCIWALHHLPDRDAALRCLREINRIREQHDAAVWIFDFARMRRPQTFRAVMDLAPAVDAQLYADGVASEAAAWTSGELEQMLREAGLADLRGGAERRIGHLQAWTSGGPVAGGGHANWSAPALQPAAADELAERISGGLAAAALTHPAS